MILTIGNQKGGVGKSTITILLANYLTYIEKIKFVNILDLDFQETAHKKYSKSLNIDLPTEYEVDKYELSEYKLISESLKNQDQGIYIIDMPGKLDDDDLINVIVDTNIFIVPFEYEEGSYESTITFVEVSKHFNPSAKFYFIPNKIKKMVKYSKMEEINLELQEYGKILPYLKDLVTFQRINTVGLTKEQEEGVKDTFSEIVNEIRLCNQNQ